MHNHEALVGKWEIFYWNKQLKEHYLIRQDNFNYLTAIKLASPIAFYLHALHVGYTNEYAQCQQEH